MEKNTSKDNRILLEKILSKYVKKKKLPKKNYVQECKLWDLNYHVLIFLN